jgi:S-DNA-T family DNA segregation ATPase FtsK/SpoIIIE
VDSATTPVAYEALSMEIVIRALLSLSIANINRAWKDNPKTAFQQVDPIARDGQGWLAKLDLPYGVTAGEVSEKREELASGLRRPLGTVWPETDHKRHPGALALYVADQDMTTAEQPAWPMAKRGQADVFAPVVFGTDPRGRPVTLTLMFASVIIGSIPRMGKTFLLRLLLLICALDIGSRSTPTTSRAPVTSSRSPGWRTGTGPATSQKTSTTCSLTCGRCSARCAAGPRSSATWTSSGARRTR